MIPSTASVIVLLLLLLLAVLDHVEALSMQIGGGKQLARGSAAKPIQKQKIAVCGAGGYLGANIFGYLQRCSSLFGTGMGGTSVPRSICSSAVSAVALNSVLSKNFVLAFAGEDQIRLTNFADVSSIATRLKSYDACVLGTAYHIEKRPVTAGSYDKTPNDKTWELYLDRPRRPDSVPAADDQELHMQIFENTLEACRLSNLKHVVVVETPQTRDAPTFMSTLQESGLPFTYVRFDGELANFRDHTYMKGLQGDVTLKSYEVDDDGKWMKDLEPADAASSGTTLYREDAAAAIVQGLQSLPWSTSRCLRIGSKGPLEGARTAVEGRYDREWFGNSDILERRMGGLV